MAKLAQKGAASLYWAKGLKVTMSAFVLSYILQKDSSVFSVNIGCCVYIDVGKKLT